MFMARTAEDACHLRAVRRAAAGGTDDFGGFAEVRRAHHRGAYDSELFHIHAAELIKAVDRASRDEQRLPGTNLNRRCRQPSR